jgi:hypothetical protein
MVSFIEFNNENDFDKITEKQLVSFWKPFREQQDFWFRMMII